MKDMTKDDLRTGMFVELRDGSKGVIVNNTIVYSDGEFSDLLEFNDDLTNVGTGLLDIVKVYLNTKVMGFAHMSEKNYEWKRGEEILDKAEKNYLTNVIAPFRDRVKCIHKINTIRVDGTYEWLTINLDNYEYISLPYFKAGTMYKNMIPNKEYTLKELHI